MFQQVAKAGFLVLCMGGVLGCSAEQKSGPTGLVPVSGTVTLDGKPLAGATVTFVPSGGGATSDAGAITDESGKYELSAGEGGGTGAVPGDYRVIISCLVKPDGTVARPEKDKSPMQLMLEENAKEKVPPAYSDMLSSKLTAKVPPGGGSIDFELKGT